MGQPIWAKQVDIFASQGGMNEDSIGHTVDI